MCGYGRALEHGGVGNAPGDTETVLSWSLSYIQGCHLDFPSLLFFCPSRSASQVLRLEMQRVLGSPWKALGAERSQAQHQE